jgi:hypothetical protein
MPPPRPECWVGRGNLRSKSVLSSRPPFIRSSASYVAISSRTDPSSPRSTVFSGSCSFVRGSARVGFGVDWWGGREGWKSTNDFDRNGIVRGGI